MSWRVELCSEVCPGREVTGTWLTVRLVFLFRFQLLPVPECGQGHVHNAPEL